MVDPTVVSVTVEAVGRSVAIPKVQDGLFAAVSTVPPIPFFLHGQTFSVSIVAARADGRSTVVTMPIQLGARTTPGPNFLSAAAFIHQPLQHKES